MALQTTETFGQVTTFKQFFLITKVQEDMAQLYQKGADPQQPTTSLTINTAKKQQHLQPQVNKLFLKATPNQYTAQN